MREFYFYQTLLPFDKWIKELKYEQSNVMWIDKLGTKHALWSKSPTLDKNGNIIMVNSKIKEIEYYDWLVQNKPELLKK